MAIDRVSRVFTLASPLRSCVHVHEQDLISQALLTCMHACIQ